MKNWKVMRAHDRGEAVEMRNREHGKWMEVRKGSPPQWNFKMYKYRLRRYFRKWTTVGHWINIETTEGIRAHQIKKYLKRAWYLAEDEYGNRLEVNENGGFRSPSDNKAVKEVDWSKVKRFDEIENIGGSEDVSKSYFIAIKGNIVNYIEINNSTNYYSMHRQYTKYLKLK